MKLKNAAQSTAYCGRSTRVETIVAIELAASCRPLRKSNSSATAIRMTRTGRPERGVHVMALPYTCSMTMRVDLVRDVVEAIGDLFEMVVDLGADDEVHGVGVAVLQKQFLQPDVVEIVDAALELGQFLGDLGQHARHCRRSIACSGSARPTRLAHSTSSVAHFAHRRLEGAHLEQHHGLGGLLHLVDGVVHGGDQVLDVAAVERGDEGAADRGQHSRVMLSASFSNWLTRWQ